VGLNAVEGSYEEDCMMDEGGTGDEERSQWRIDPSDPPETRMGWNGCHVTADRPELEFWLRAEEYTTRTTDFFFVASEGLNFSHGSDIEDPNGLVS